MDELDKYLDQDQIDLEAIEKEDWELVREVIAYLSDDDVFEQYREDEDWWKGADDKD